MSFSQSSSPSLVVRLFTGPAMGPFLPDLARLRMAVFREFPYLYEGSPESEARSVAEFGTCPGAGLAVAFDGEMAVGCATCRPLAAESAGVIAPFLARGWDIGRFCYFGESVLLPAYRGRGAGVDFFRAREAHAAILPGCDFAAFCSVIRPDDHPHRPANAVKLDEFWRHRGFHPEPGLICTMRWKQIDTEDKVENHLAFWLKSLTGAALPPVASMDGRSA
jgi:GNAT superfamily N-acetyltransferase